LETHFDGGYPPGAAVASERSWYVVHVMPHPVDLFARRFIGQLGIEYLHLTELRRRPRKKPLRVASLPGYLFVRFDAERDPWQMIYRSPGVIEILSSEEGTPVAITDEEMETVIDTHHRRFHEKSHEWDWPSWRLGQDLLVTRGPLAGRRAVFISFVGRTTRTGRHVGGDATHYATCKVSKDDGGEWLARFNVSDLQPGGAVR
jgi:transcription antitermination factor NusG